LQLAIDETGLENCTELIAMATPAQLAAILDVDLWHSPPGRDETFDAERFGQWLEVLLTLGLSEAAHKVAALPIALTIAGLANHVRVLDEAQVSAYETSDGELIERPYEDAITCKVGGYLIVATRQDSWGAINRLLPELFHAAPEFFDRVMRGIRVMSDSGFEEDGLDTLLHPRDQMMFDLAADREERREAQGFVTPADARAFLKGARDLHHRDAAEGILRAYLRAIDGDRKDDEAVLGFLANVLMAGCAVQARAFTAKEASAGAVAICQLGVSRWRRALPVDGQNERDLIATFETGWRTLYTDVSLFAAAELIAVLAETRSHDLKVQSGINTLRRDLTTHWRAGEPWRASELLDVIISVDPPAWAALVGLIAECPVMHAALPASIVGQTQAVDEKAFTFFSDASQIDPVREFMRMLPEFLRR
jgi:hypothetical protein